MRLCGERGRESSFLVEWGRPFFSLLVFFCSLFLETTRTSLRSCRMGLRVIAWADYFFSLSLFLFARQCDFTHSCWETLHVFLIFRFSFLKFTSSAARAVFEELCSFSVSQN